MKAGFYGVFYFIYINKIKHYYVNSPLVNFAPNKLHPFYSSRVFFTSVSSVSYHISEMEVKEFFCIHAKIIPLPPRVIYATYSINTWCGLFKILWLYLATYFFERVFEHWLVPFCLNVVCLLWGQRLLYLSQISYIQTIVYGALGNHKLQSYVVICTARSWGSLSFSKTSLLSF